MKSVILSLAACSLVACASSGTRGTMMRPPELPSVDRIAHLIRAQLGDAASADLDVCVAPSGRVTDVTLARTSTLRAFDDAGNATST